MAKNFRYIKSLDSSQPNQVNLIIAANQTIVTGDLLVLSSGKGAKAGAAATAIFGIAQGSITTGGSPTDADAIPVLVINSKSVLRVKYTGSALTSANLWGTAYDMNSSQVLDTSDTTGGFMLPVDLPNTTTTEQDVIIKHSALFNA